MPSPNPGEKKTEYISRCVEELVSKENRSPEQAVVICNVFWNQSQGKIKSSNTSGVLKG